MEVLLSCVWLAVVAWLILRAYEQRKLFRPITICPEPDVDDAARVAVIIPVRNEEHNIGGCLNGILAQRYPWAKIQVLVVDDHSTDRTVALAKAVAQTHAQIRVNCTPRLPPRWIGKSHACWFGANAVVADTEWLCFLDADVEAEPSLLASAVATARAERLDLLSLAPRQRLESFAERLVMPCGIYLLGFVQDLKKRQSSQGDDVTATGQFMLIRRSTYHAVGGHAAICTSICEDFALAQLIKRAGGKVVLRDGRQLLRTRMYAGWQTLWPGLAKNLVHTLGGPAATVMTAAVAIVLAWAAWLMPLAYGFGCAQDEAGSCVALAPALVGSAAVFGLHVAGAAYFEIPVWYGLVFPLGYAAGALIALDSLRRRLTGHVTWKGRTYS